MEWINASGRAGTMGRVAPFVFVLCIVVFVGLSCVAILGYISSRQSGRVPACFAKRITRHFWTPVGTS
jgi:hypothetical protein